MKNQISLFFLLVTYCYCQNETTDTYSVTENQSETLYNDQNITESGFVNTTSIIKTTEVVTASKIKTTEVETTLVIKTKEMVTTTKITAITENPILRNISADVYRLVMDLLPSFLSTPEKVQSMDINRTELFDELDKLKLNWRQNCSSARIYLRLLEDEFERNKNLEVVSENRLKMLIPCKRDCNFDRLLNANYSGDEKIFSKTFLPYVNQEVSQFCLNTLGKFLEVNNSIPLNLEEITKINNGSFPLGSIFSQSQIATIPANEALSVIKLFKDLIDDNSARKLATKIPTNTSFSDVAHVAAFVPAEILSNADPSDLISNLDSFSQKIDNSKAILVATRIASNGTKEQIKEFLGNSGSRFAEKIPLSIILQNGLSVADLPDHAISSSFREHFLTNSLSSSVTLADLNETLLITVASRISRDELNKVPNNQKKNTVLSLLKASSKSSQPFTSSQRSAFLDSMLQTWSNLNNTEKANEFDKLSNEDVEAIAELIISANESVYTWLRNTQKFPIVIEKNSKMDSSKCCSFLYRSRTLYTSEAIRKLVNTPSSITSNDLNRLGPCFAGLIPKEYLENLPDAHLESQIDFFNSISIQPNSSTFTTLKTKFERLYDSKSTDSEKISLLGKMGSLIIFMNETKVNQNLIKNSVSLMLSKIKNERDLKNQDVARCRIGSGDDNLVSSFINSWNKHLVGSWFSIVSSRRKRSVTKLTCDTANQIIDAIDLIGESYLASMEENEFENCIGTLGSSLYTLSPKQYAELAKKKPISEINDADILNFNKILTGYSDTDLAKLKIESLTSIQTLGQIDSFSSSQISSLVSAIRTKMGQIDNLKFNYLGNLACALSSTDLTQISNDFFKQNIKAVSIINMAGCGSIELLYNKAKVAMNFNLTSVQIADIGSVVAGISVNEAKTLNSRAIQAFSQNTLHIIPATIVNSLSAAQIQSFGSNQLSSLLNSPNADQFSDITKNLLTNAVQNVDVTRDDILSIETSSSSSTKFNILILIFSLVFRIF